MLHSFNIFSSGLWHLAAFGGSLRRLAASRGFQADRSQSMVLAKDKVTQCIMYIIRIVVSTESCLTSAVLRLQLCLITLQLSKGVCHYCRYYSLVNFYICITRRTRIPATLVSKFGSCPSSMFSRHFSLLNRSMMDY